jgi:hypothetical protein
MADDEEEEVKKDEGEGEDEGDEEGGGGIGGSFSKVGGMLSGGGDEGDEGEGDAAAKDGDEKKPKAAPKSLFDIAALKEFGLNVLTLFIETVVISVICVNILFYCDPKSIRVNNLNLPKLFPTDRHEWPYCYTSEYTSCEADCEDKFGGIADDPKNSSAKKIYLKAAIILDTYIFKWFCLTTEELDMVKESVDEGVTKVNLLNWDFIKVRFKQWVNNSFIFSFSSDRAMLLYILNYITKLTNSIPKELYDVVSPLMILLMPFVFLLIAFFAIGGGPLFTTIIGMIINPTEHRKEFIGGSLWSIFTGFGILGILPFVSFVVQLIQFLGTFCIYPFLHWNEYRLLYAKYVPIIFFFFNLVLMFYAFEGLDINVAAIVILALLILYLTTYWEGIMNFINKIKNWGA